MFEKLKLSPLYGLSLPLYHRLDLCYWLISSKTTLTPYLIKQQIVKEYAEKYNITIFVETGTYLGTMVISMRNIFRRLYTIELDEKLYKFCKKKLSKWKHVRLIQGDSSEKLPEVVKSITKPTLFWLDAHYSSTITAGALQHNPLMTEVKAILKHPIKGHVILIDDAYAFQKPNVFPSIGYLRRFVKKSDSSWVLRVEDDIIRIYNKNEMRKV